MDIWYRIVRYLLLWLILFGVLCVISVIRHWDALVAIASNTFDSYLSTLISMGLMIGLMIWGLRLLLRGFR